MRGLTLVEVLVALVILTGGLLTLAGETGRLVRQLARAERATWVGEAAVRRLELLWADGCGKRSGGAEVVRRGENGAVLATLTWDWSGVSDSSYRALLITMPAPLVGVPPARPDTLVTAVDCRR